MTSEFFIEILHLPLVEPNELQLGEYTKENLMSYR